MYGRHDVTLRQPQSQQNIRDFTYKVLYNVIYGLYAAILENDRKTFNYALKAIQNCTWKLNEKKLYGKKLFDIEKKLYSCGAESVGMSSLGPGLFFLSKNVNAVINGMRDNTNCMFLHTKPSNNGRVIENV